MTTEETPKPASPPKLTAVPNTGESLSPAAAAAKRKQVQRDEQGRIILASPEEEEGVQTLFLALVVAEPEQLIEGATAHADEAKAAWDKIVSQVKADNPRPARESRDTYKDRIGALSLDIAGVAADFLKSGKETVEAIEAAFASFAALETVFVVADDEDEGLDG